MNAPRITRPRRPEGAPDLPRYVTVDDVMRVAQLPRSSAYRVLHLVAERAGLDLSRGSRSTKALRLPVAAWEAHAAADAVREALYDEALARVNGSRRLAAELLRVAHSRVAEAPRDFPRLAARWPAGPRGPRPAE